MPGYDGSAFTLDSVDDEFLSDSDVDGDSEIDVCQPIEDLHSQLPTEHIGCFTHTLQLTIQDGFKESRGIDAMISKCSKIVAHVRKSTVATEILGGVNRLQTENYTRWNSQLTMILSVPKKCWQRLKCHN